MTEERRLHRCEDATTNLTDDELIKYASGSLALQGVLMCANVYDQLKSREILLRVPRDAKLLGPTIDQSEKSECFVSNESEELHKQSMNSFGFGLKATLTLLQYAGVVIEASAAAGLPI